MQFELFVAARYLRAKRRQAVIGVITVISIIGVAAGVASLIIALAINNGFRQDLQDRLLGSTSHINLLRVAKRRHSQLGAAAGASGEAAARGRRSARHLRAGADLARSARAGRGAEGHHSQDERKVSAILDSIKQGSRGVAGRNSEPQPREPNFSRYR